MFDTLEKSRFGGKPTHLFAFTRQGVTLRFCTGAVDFPVGANTYVAAQIERGEIRQTVERAKDKITIKLAYLRDPAATDLPATQAIGDWWHPYIPGDRVDVVCMAAHRGDSDAPVIEWMGKVVQPKFGDVELELTCLPYGDEAQARGQGPRWQKACWKTPYSQGIRGCGMDPADFTIEATPTVAGLVLTDAAFGTAPLNLFGGKFQWIRTDGLVESRYIVAHSGDSITLLYGGDDLETGIAGTALPSCPKTWAACAARFPDPENHYGGAVYKPIKNPTDGVSMSWG